MMFAHLTHDCRDQALISRAIASTREIRKSAKEVLFWFGNSHGFRAAIFDVFEADCIIITPR